MPLIAIIAVVLGLVFFGVGMYLWSGSSVTEPDPNYGRGIGLAVFGIGLFFVAFTLLP